MDFADYVQNDVKDIFLKEFSQTAIYKSEPSTIKNVTVQFFESSLDSMQTTYFHAWCDFSELPRVKKQDTLEINGVVYGIVDFSPDEFDSGLNLFLQEIKV